MMRVQLRRGPGDFYVTYVPELIGATGESGDPDISPDGLTLAFDSSRSGGSGLNDIYFATRTCN